MHIEDQDQATQTNDEGSSATSTTSTEAETGSSSSTTDQTQTDKLDLSADDTAATDTDTTEDTRTDEEKAAEAERAELFGAPADDEGYTIEGLPEGMEIDKEALDAVTPAFRELGLSSKGASKVAQVYAEKVLPQVMEGAVKKIEADVVAQRSTWEGEALAAVQNNGQDLKNKAGEPLSFDAKDIKVVRQTAAKALDHLAPEGFREFLDQTGLSVHPAMVAFAYQAGRLLAEDRDIETTDRGGKRTSSVAPAKSGGMHTDKFFDRG